MSPSSITWIPAHPCYDGVSMRRYWQSLAQAWRESDRYQIGSVIRPLEVRARAGFAGKAERLWQRRFAYPAVIRRNCSGPLAHILDHSWGDMLRAIPKTVKTVVTVHDLIPLRFQDHLTDSQLKRFRSWVDACRQADHLIAVSDYTKREIVELLKYPEDRISVVPNGVDHPTANFHVSDRISSAIAAAGRRFLIGSLGSVLGRKNLAILPEALGRFEQLAGSKVCLVRAGSRLPASIVESIHLTTGPESLVELGFLADDELDGFYEVCDVIAVPSRYEGFGLPVLEAMARATPVVAANASSLPEVGGDAAVYFDPESPMELARALAGLLSPEVRGPRARQGLERSAAYSWRRCLEGVYGVYDRLLS